MEVQVNRWRNVPSPNGGVRLELVPVREIRQIPQMSPENQDLAARMVVSAVIGTVTFTKDIVVGTAKALRRTQPIKWYCDELTWRLRELFRKR